MEFYKGSSLNIKFETVVPETGTRKTITGYLIRVEAQGYQATVTPIDDYSFKAEFAATTTTKFTAGLVDVVLFMTKLGKTAVGKASGLIAVDPATKGVVIGGVEDPVEVPISINENDFNFDVTLNNVFSYEDFTEEQKQDIISGIQAEADVLFLEVNQSIDNANAATLSANNAANAANAAADNANNAATAANNAAQDAINATNDAEAATINANNAANDAEVATLSANNAASAANTAAAAANTAAEDVENLLQNIQTLPQATLYLNTGNTLTPTAPSVDVTVPIALTGTAATVINLTYTAPESGFVSYRSTYTPAFYVRNLNVNRTYNVALAWFIGTTKIAEASQTLRPSGPNVLFTFPLTNNLLTTNVEYLAGQVFTLRATISKDGVPNETIEAYSTTNQRSGFTRNGGAISSGEMVDFNGLSTKTQAQRNREYEAALPHYKYADRVAFDGGSVRNKQALFDSYKTALDLLQNTVLAFSPEIGVKQSANGLVYKASKLYDMSPLSNDANQATAGLQPYLGGNIAPNERMWLWGTNKALPFTPIAFSGTSKWSVSFVVDITAISGLGTKSILHASAPIISLTSYNNLTFRDKTNNLNNFTFNLSQLPKISRFYLVAKGDNTLSLYINGVLNATLNIANTTEATFNQIFWSFENPKLYSLRILNKDLSKSEIENLDKFLSNIYLEYETTAIGSQAWLTSNHIGNVTSDGFVIPEVQPNNSSVTYLSNFASGIDSFEAISNSSLSGNNDSILGIDDTLKWLIVASGASTLRKAISIPYGAFKVSFDYYIPNTCSINRLMVTDYGASGNYLDTNILGFTKGSWVTVTGNINITAGTAANGLRVYAYNGAAADEVYIKNFKVESMGWADSQTIYDNNIAAGKSVLEASRAASMWCKYNNSDDNAAVYGYLYNWWAAYLFSLYPPKGLRVPTKADLEQKNTTLGGSTIAGGKLKKEGISYWNSPNVGATNESGFTALGTGRRNATGVFQGEKAEYMIASATSDTTTTAFRLNCFNSDQTTAILAIDKRWGFSLRFLKNAPVGDLFEEIDTGTFTQNIASSQRELAVKFGYSIEAIRVYSSTSLTNIKVEARTTAGVLLATLLPTGSTTAGVPYEFKVTQGMPIQLQDYKLWITASGNSGDGMRVICNIKKSIL